jgi:hypothetical protein
MNFAVFGVFLCSVLLCGVDKASSSFSGTVSEHRSLKSKGDCNDADWCNVPMPTKSLFGFDPPTDSKKWNEARLMASSGEQVLLSKIAAHFPNYLDFLDGDTQFRNMHFIPDFFIDKNRDLTPLLSQSPLKAKDRIIHEPYKWGNERVLPRDHNFYDSGRAPIFKLGYYAFSKSGGAPLFGGPEVGKEMVGRSMLLEYWSRVKDVISTPFIALDVHDENWGLFSTQFPNRTANWGLCCTEKETALIHEFLNHNMTLLVVINQHSNITHPKLVTLPRGLPLHTEHGQRIIWDTMRTALSKKTKKDKFVYVSSSNAVHRPQILQCIKKRFNSKKPDDFVVHATNPADAPAGRLAQMTKRIAYYQNLATTRVGIAVPGIGYDTYRSGWCLTVCCTKVSYSITCNTTRLNDFDCVCVFFQI